MKTGFSPARMADTQQAHRAAQRQFYPRLFPGLAIAFESTVDEIADLKYAVDCRVAVTVRQPLRAPLTFSVQERWRTDLDAMSWGDVTVTEWNVASDTPSELHKLGAHLFVYGFYDKAGDRIVEAVCINVAGMLLALALGKLPYKPRLTAGRDQTFVPFTVRDLENVGAIILKTW